MDFWEVLQQRRSIRKFKSEPVDVSVLTKLVEAARLAQNNGNSQPWDFVFITEPDMIKTVQEVLVRTTRKYWSEIRTDALSGEKLEKVLPLFTDMGPVPVFLLACLNPRVNRMHAEYQEWNDLWNQHSVAAALTNLMLAAVNEGLGTCWLATPTMDTDELKEKLSIPAPVQIIAVTPVGYPDEAPKQRPRIPVEEIIHFDKW